MVWEYQEAGCRRVEKVDQNICLPCFRALSNNQFHPLWEGQLTSEEAPPMNNGWGGEFQRLIKIIQFGVFNNDSKIQRESIYADH